MREKKISKYQSKTGTNSGASFNFPLDQRQKEVVSQFYKNQINILTGDPGTTKTFMACHFALKMLSQGQVEKIIISKSPIETGKGIGFLPGELEDKLAPFKESYIETLKKVGGDNYVQYCLDKKQIVFEPMGFVRGKSFESAVIILDEIQNCTLKELMSFTTRICEDSQMILAGDFYQTDIRDSGLKDFINICSDIENISYIELDDTFQKRAKIITAIFNNYKKFVDNKLISNGKNN